MDDGVDGKNDENSGKSEVAVKKTKNSDEANRAGEATKDNRDAGRLELQNRIAAYGWGNRGLG